MASWSVLPDDEPPKPKPGCILALLLMAAVWAAVSLWIASWRRG